MDDNSNHAMMPVALQDFHSGHSGAVIKKISLMVYIIPSDISPSAHGSLATLAQYHNMQYRTKTTHYII